VTAKTARGWIVLVLLAIAGVAAWWLVRRPGAPAPPVPDRVAIRSAPPARATTAASTVRSVMPGRARAGVAPGDRDPGVIDGRVLDGDSHEGVADAELTLLGEGVASSVRTAGDGTFELTPTVTGSFVVSEITAPGYLPYVPERTHPELRVTLARGRAVRGVTLLLYRAVDHHGLVVDARGAPVAGARVRWLGSPASEQPLDGPAVEWTTDRHGSFTFQAAADAVLEASHGGARGWARLDARAARARQLTIPLGGPPRDATITGHVRDTSGAPIALARVRASSSFGSVAAVFATTGPGGEFTLTGVDRASYDLSAEAEDHVRSVRGNVLGGSRDVALTLDAGLPLSGQVVDAGGAPVAVFTLVVRRRAGAARPVLATRSLVDPEGRFAVRVPRGDYDLLVSTPGRARPTQAEAPAGATDARIVVGSGATLRGEVIASDDHAPIGNASIACETTDAGPRDPPAEPAAVTRPDGSFELTGISPGPLALRIRAQGFHARIAAEMTASDGAALGPLTIALTRVGPDEASGTEMVGLGLRLSPDGEALRVDSVLPGSGAFDAGIGFGDLVVAIDGAPVAPLGVEGTIARTRGAAGTTVTLTLRRDGQDVALVIERRQLRGY